MLARAVRWDSSSSTTSTRVTGRSVSIATSIVPAGRAVVAQISCYDARQMQLRPSLKFVKLSYLLCLLLAAAIGVYLLVDQTHPDYFIWFLVVPGFLLIMTVIRHIERRVTKLEIIGDHLRY